MIHLDAIVVGEPIDQVRYLNGIEMIHKSTMRQDFGSPDNDLLTTEEANAVIQLYAKREQERRAEAERLAAMPRLADVANLVGAAPEELFPLLDRVRHLPPLGDNSERTPDQRMTQEESEDLIELYGQLEFDRQEELEQRAQLSTLDEVAKGLRIPVDQASDFLQEVRKQKELEAAQLQAILEPLLQFTDEQLPEEVVLEDEPTTYDEVDSPTGLRMEIPTNIALWTICIATLIILTIGWTLTSKKSYVSPASPATLVSSSQLPSLETARPEFPSYNNSYLLLSVNSALSNGQAETIDANFISPPSGWTVRVVGQQGVAIAYGQGSPALTGRSLRSRLRVSAESLVSAVEAGAQASPQSIAPIEMVPFQPTNSPMLHSDIHGYVLVEVSNGKITRRCYVARGVNISREGTRANLVKEQLERRLDELVQIEKGSRVSNLWPRVERVKPGISSPPPGVRLTLLADGHAYQIESEGHNDTLQPDEIQASLQRSITSLLDYARKQNASGLKVRDPQGQTSTLFRDQAGGYIVGSPDYWIEVSYPRATMALDIGDYSRASSPGNGDVLDRINQNMAEFVSQVAYQLSSPRQAP